MPENNSFLQTTMIILIALFALNLLIVDVKIFAPQKFSPIVEKSTSQSPTPTVSGSAKPADAFCPANCLSFIDQKLSDATQSPRIGENLSTQLQPTSPPVVQQAQKREYYVPFGSGSTSKNSWDDITSTETIIDPANYGQIVEAFFIAGLKNPTKNGQVEAQLYNVTDKNVVYGSHIVMKDQTEQMISSGKFSLPTSAKLYRVQLKSTLSYPASLENAKLKIITL